MRINRRKIESYEFKVKKGKYYEGKGVDAALDEIADGVEELLLEIESKEARIRELENRDKEVTEALLMVKKLSEEIVERAKNEAEKAVMEKAAEALVLKEEINSLVALRDKYKSELIAEVRRICAEAEALVNNENK